MIRLPPLSLIYSFIACHILENIYWITFDEAGITAQGISGGSYLRRLPLENDRGDSEER
jgi:hypothetical protein